MLPWHVKGRGAKSYSKLGYYNGLPRIILIEQAGYARPWLVPKPPMTRTLVLIVTRHGHGQDSLYVHGHG